MQKVNCKNIKKAIGISAWDLSNQVLYDLCQNHFHHNDDQEIIAKVLLIGRVYSAAIERRKQVDNNSKAFYSKKVAPAVRNSEIDIWLDALKDFKHPTSSNCMQIVSVHKKVTNLFGKISELEKRFLASKYLHFHFPALFFIYDSRSSSAIRQVEQMPIWNPNLVEYDYAYAKFFLRCMAFTERVKNECRENLTPRQLDKYLLS